MILAWLATFALTIGAGCFYLAAPHQALVAVPVSGRALRLAGMIGLVVALGLLLMLMGPATAIFTWTVGLMFLWSVPPVVLRWLRYRKENAR